MTLKMSTHTRVDKLPILWAVGSIDCWHCPSPEQALQKVDTKELYMKQKKTTFHNEGRNADKLQLQQLVTNSQETQVKIANCTVPILP